jgi:hypothetical protein
MGPADDPEGMLSGSLVEKKHLETCSRKEKKQDGETCVTEEKVEGGETVEQRKPFSKDIGSCGQAKQGLYKRNPGIGDKTPVSIQVKKSQENYQGNNRIN